MCQVLCVAPGMHADLVQMCEVVIPSCELQERVEPEPEGGKCSAAVIQCSRSQLL